MKVFASSDYYKRFVRPLCAGNHDIVAGKSEVMRFPNGEMRAVVNEDVNGEKCLVIGSLAPPDEQLLSLLMLTNALKRSGAYSVVAVLPYLGYGRQDKFKPGESGGIALVGSMLRASGVDEIITIDTHSKLDHKLIGLPLTSLYPSSLFKFAIQDIGLGDDVTIVAPDEGAIGRAQAMAEVLKITRPVAHLVKKRVDGIVHLNLSGEVSSQVLMVDDIVDSGHTLVSACNLLRGKGVQDIVVIATHGLFTGGDWKQLFGLGVRTIFISDSCPEATALRHPNVQVVSLKPLLSTFFSETIKKEKQYENVSS